nr:MAG TPA: hypothetical protein [Caudoviricetes sp.]
MNIFKVIRYYISKSRIGYIIYCILFYIVLVAYIIVCNSVRFSVVVKFFSLHYFLYIFYVLSCELLVSSDGI